MPVPNTTAVGADVLILVSMTGLFVEIWRGAYVCEQTKCDHEASEEESVHGPMKEAGHKWEKKKQGEQDANCSDDFCVDKALLVPC